MIGEIEKFWDWATKPYADGYRRMKKNAPAEIKKEAKEYDRQYFKQTGRHALVIDY